MTYVLLTNNILVYFLHTNVLTLQLVDRHVVLTANREERGPSGPRRRPGGRSGISGFSGMGGLGAMIGMDRW